jgi:hypothetical protein
MPRKRTRVSGLAAVSVMAAATTLMSVQTVAAAGDEHNGANCQGQTVSALARQGLTPAALAPLLNTDPAGVNQLINDLCAGGTSAIAAVQKVREAAGVPPPPITP